MSSYGQQDRKWESSTQPEKTGEDRWDKKSKGSVEVKEMRSVQRRKGVEYRGAEVHCAGALRHTPVRC